MTEDTPVPSAKANRIVVALGVLSLVGLGIVAALWFAEMSRVVRWTQVSRIFLSGEVCYIFPEAKLVLLFGEEKELGGQYDRILGRGSTIMRFGSVFGSGGGSATRNGSVSFLYKSNEGRAEMEFLNGKHKMTVSRRGNLLTLADGRQIPLDGQTPVWLRCNDDGTILILDELPEKLAEHMETSPDESPEVRACFRK